MKYETRRLAMPARINLAAPEALIDKIHQAAKTEAMTTAEFMRDAIRRRVRQIERGTIK